MGAYTRRTDIVCTKTGAHVLLLPGILARAAEQYEPLMEILELRNYSVSGFDYDEPLNVDGVANDICDVIRHNIEIKQTTILVGASFGGMVAAKVVKRLREQTHMSNEELRPLVSSIFIDSPADGNDLVVPAPSLARWVVNHFTPSTDANRGYGAWLLKPRSAGLPKQSETTLPAGSTYVSHDQIRETARMYLSGHSFTLWHAQLKWMLNATLELEELEGLDTIYLSCTQGNVTVKQPQASEKWSPHVRLQIDVSTPHCAFLQQQDIWRGVFEFALARLSTWQYPKRVA